MPEDFLTIRISALAATYIAARLSVISLLENAQLCTKNHDVYHFFRSFPYSQYYGYSNAAQHVKGWSGIGSLLITLNLTPLKIVVMPISDKCQSLLFLL